MSAEADAGVKRVKMSDADKVVGGYIVLWRKDVKTACQIESVDKDAKKIVYKIINGPDEGKRFMSRYDSSQTVELYDEGNVILAALKT